MVLVSVCILVPKYACEAVMSDVASLSTVTCCNYWVFELTNAWNTGKLDRYKKEGVQFYANSLFLGSEINCDSRLNTFICHLPSVTCIDVSKQAFPVHCLTVLCA